MTTGRKRRGHGEGAVFQRESDGRWVGSITVGRTAEGRQKRRVVYGNTKAEALAKLRELQNQFAAGAMADPSALTVEAWLARWSETAGRQSGKRRSGDGRSTSPTASTRTSAPCG